MWLNAGYDLLTRNCCHWCSSFCMSLGVSRLPEWLTSLADAGAAIVTPRENTEGSTAAIQAELGTTVTNKTLGVKHGDHGASNPDKFGFAKVAHEEEKLLFHVSKPGSRTPGAPACAWQGEDPKHPSSARKRGVGQVYSLDGNHCTPGDRTRAGRRQASGQHQHSRDAGKQRKQSGKVVLVPSTEVQRTQLFDACLC